MMSKVELRRIKSMPIECLNRYEPLAQLIVLDDVKSGVRFNSMPTECLNRYEPFNTTGL